MMIDFSSLIVVPLIQWFTTMPVVGLIVLTTILLIVEQIKPIRIKIKI